MRQDQSVEIRWKERREGGDRQFQILSSTLEPTFEVGKEESHAATWGTTSQAEGAASTEALLRMARARENRKDAGAMGIRGDNLGSALWEIYPRSIQLGMESHPLISLNKHYLCAS